MLLLIFSLLAIGLSFLTYYLAGFFNQTPWFLFLLLAFFVGYLAILTAFYWFGLVLTALRYKGKEPNKVNMFYFLNIRLLADFTLFINLVFVRKKNFKQLPKEPGLVLFNHVSNYDFMTIQKCMGGKYAFIGKKELKKRPMTGQLTSAIGTLFIDRGNPDSSRVMVDNAVEYITNKNTSVCIAPEGTRSHTGIIAPFKHGGFHIALQSKCPISLLCLKGMEKVSQRKIIKPCSVDLVLIEVIKPEEYEGMTAGQLAEYCEQKYKKFLNQL